MEGILWVVTVFDLKSGKDVGCPRIHGLSVLLLLLKTFMTKLYFLDNFVFYIFESKIG